MGVSMNARAAMQNVCLTLCILVIQNLNSVGYAEEFQFLNFPDELRGAPVALEIKPALYPLTLPLDRSTIFVIAGYHKFGKSDGSVRLD